MAKFSVPLHLLISNFDDSRALSGNYNFGSMVAGEPCCPFSLDRDFEEQIAQSFTLASTATLSTIEMVLLERRGNVDSVRVSLSRSSNTNPGGSSSELGYQAPDLNNIIESWLLEDALSRSREKISIHSALLPQLKAGEMFWITLTPGREINEGESIYTGWVAGDIPQGSSSVFATRNNINGGSVADQRWITGRGQPIPSQAGYSLRVFGKIPIPSSSSLMAIGLLAVLLARKRHYRQAY